MNHSCAPYMLPAPYPAPASEIKPNPAVARRLLAAYAGSGGELTAVGQYFYNSLLAPVAGARAVGDLFACVSRVEMHHLELLGELILAYGGDPGFLAYQPNGRTAWWSGSYLSYDKQPAKMLKNAIAGEQAAIADYRRTLSYMQDAPSARALLERIIADEEHHITLFNAALASL